MKKRNLLNLFIIVIVPVYFFACSKKEVPVAPVVPGCTTNMAPANGTNITTSKVTLTWAAANGAATYDVYLGTTNNPATVVATNVSGTTYEYTLPANGNTYYWYVVPKSSSGAAAGCASAVTAFTYLIIKAPAALNFPVISYFPSYRSVAEYPDVMFKMCDVVIYAFGNVNVAGSVDIANPAVFQQLYDKAKANGSKVFLSTSGEANFKTMAATAAGRLHFIKDIMNKVRQYKLDGVDIDWEYPRTMDGTDVTYAELMRQLSDSLHVDGKYYLGTAITPGIYGGSVRDGIKTEVFNYADIFNIMAYDDFSTDPNYPYKQHSSMNTATVSMNYWLNIRAMPKQKFILGLPAYGRNSGAAQVSTSYKTVLATGIQLGPAPLSQSDSAIITRTDGTSFTTYYNGMLTIKAKTLLAKERANGIFFWEMGHDANNEYSLLKVAAAAAGKSY